MADHETANSRIFEGRDMVDRDTGSPVLWNISHPSLEMKGWPFTFTEGNIKVGCIIHEVDWWRDADQVKAAFLEFDKPGHEQHNNDMWDKWGPKIIAIGEQNAIDWTATQDD